MIIFAKQKDGTFQKSGEILPTERYYCIAVDAENPERMALPCDQAVQEVENRIKAGTKAYRYELASPPASFHKAARRRAEKGIKRILTKTREQKRAAIIATKRFQKAYAKAKAATDRKKCAHGHKITPKNTHFGDLFRTGLITCDLCNQKAQARYAKKGKR
jgi:hypothetical protein